MRGEEEQTARRLTELAARAAKPGMPCFTGFLSPPEAELALLAGRKARVDVALEGGYEDAERRMARFADADAWEESFPITALELCWPHQPPPTHRDLLGSVMGLGLKRQCVGDIVLMEDRACLFAEAHMAGHIAGALTGAGRTSLQVRQLDQWPHVEPPQGVELRETVMSLRLDAVVSSGFGLSRAVAAELIAAGRVKLRHLPTERVDAHVEQGDAISVRGYGRLRLEEVGAPTRKGRLPVRLIRYGQRQKR